MRKMQNDIEKEILETYNWIKTKKYNDDITLSWEERYKKLEKHHIEETSFLIGKVRDIVSDNLVSKNKCEECSTLLESGTVFCSSDCRRHYYSN